MKLGKKKTAISLAVGTLFITLLTISSYGSAYKCTSDCTAPTVSLSDLTVENLYRALSYAAEKAISGGVSEANAAPQKPQVRVKAQKVSVGTENVLKRTLVAILLLCATESHRTTVSD